VNEEVDVEDFWMDPISEAELAATQPKHTVGDYLFDDTTEYIVDESGARKGVKNARFDLIPPEALSEIAAVYGYGEKKYPSKNGKPNYMNGFRYMLLIGAMLRHVFRWVAGEDYDKETGIHHLAHAAWYPLTLMTYQFHKIGTDDRYKK